MKRAAFFRMRRMPASRLLARGLLALGLLALATRLTGSEAAANSVMPGAVAAAFLLTALGLSLASRLDRIDRRPGTWLAMLLIAGGVGGFFADLHLLAAAPMPAAVAFSFAVSGGILLAWSRRRLLLGQSLLGVLCLLLWQMLFSWCGAWQELGIVSQRALSPTPDTMFGLLLLVLAISSLWAEHGYWRRHSDEHPERRLQAGWILGMGFVAFNIGMLMLTLAAQLVLLASGKALQSELMLRRAGFELVLRSTSERLKAALASEAHCHADDVVACWRSLQANFPELRAGAVRIVRPGRNVSEAGDPGLFSGRHWMVLDGSGELVWRETPWLIVQRPFAGDGRISLVVPLDGWMYGLAVRFGNTDETFGLAEQDDGGDVRPLDRPGEALRMTASWRATMPGIVAGLDQRGQRVLAAYAPLAEGLGLVQKIDVDEAVQALRQWSWAVVIGSFLFGGAAGHILFRLLYPLVATQLRHSRRHHQLVENMPVAVLLGDDEGRIEFCNAAAQRLYGEAGGELCGGRIDRLFDVPGMAAWRELAIGEERIVRCGTRGGDGRSIPVEVRFRRETWDGRACLFVTIADRREEVERQAELETWETVFMNATWGIVLGDAGGQVISNMNPAFARMHGYEREELLGRPITDVFAPAERGALKGHIEQAHRLGQYAFESVHLRQDGTEFPVHIDVSTVRDAAGQIRMRIVNVQDISRRNEMERRLRDSEQMRRIVLDTQRDMIVRYLPDSRVVFANLAYAEIFGHSPDSIVGLRWLDLVAVLQPAVAAELAVKLGELEQRPARIEHLLEIEHVAAGSLWVQWTTLPLYDENGALQGFQSSGHDVSARKAAEDALQKSESWFRTLFDSMFHYAVVLDVAGRIVAVNRIAAAFLGRPHHELLGSVLWELETLNFSPEERRRRQNIVERAATGEEVRAESTVITPQGREYVFAFSYRPIVDRDGKVASILLEAYDMTSFRDQERRISEREARFQGVAENMPGIVFEFVRENERLRGIYVNQASASLLGVDRDDFESGRVALTDCLHPEDRQSFLTAIEYGERRQRELRWVGRLARARGGWVSICASQRQSAGRALWSGVGLDITEIKETEIEIEHSRSQLRELAAHYENVREDERRVMAREVHDELGQNLTALRMGLAVLAEQPGDLKVDEEARRLKGLVDHSISVVRGIARTLRPAAMDLGIASALRWLVSEFEANTHIRCEIDIDIGRLQLDDERATTLFRIAQESLTNVARHAQAKRSWIRLRQLNRFVVLEVGDDGQGFLVSESMDGGFGMLGMKERALSIGGELVVYSRPGEGTVVSVHIPKE